MSSSSRRDPRAYLWDVITAADHAIAFTAGLTFAVYEKDVLLRSAVERELEILGGALARLAATTPNLGTRIPDLDDVVGFRDVLLHRYWGLDDRIAWSLVVEKLPRLRATVQALLDELNE